MQFIGNRYSYRQPGFVSLSSHQQKEFDCVLDLDRKQSSSAALCVVCRRPRADDNPVIQLAGVSINAASGSVCSASPRFRLCWPIVRMQA